MTSAAPQGSTLAAPRSLAPGAVLLVLVGLLCCTLAVLGAISTPWLGLRLVPAPMSANVLLLSAHDAVVGAHAPAVLLSIGATSVADAAVRSKLPPALAGRSIPLEASDVGADPRRLDDYADVRALFKRQSDLADVLTGSLVRLDVAARGGHYSFLVEPAARRPAASLPPAFWVQLAIGLGVFVAGALLWLRRPEDWARCMAGAGGVAAFAAIVAPAVYAVRELAIDGRLFAYLSALATIGALGLGCACTLLLLRFPTPVGATPLLHWLAMGFGALLVGELLQMWPAPLTANAMKLSILAILVCLVLQGFASRRSRHGRRALLMVGMAGIAGLAVTAALHRAGTAGWTPAVPPPELGLLISLYVGIACAVARMPASAGAAPGRARPSGH